MASTATPTIGGVPYTVEMIDPREIGDAKTGPFRNLRPDPVDDEKAQSSIDELAITFLREGPMQDPGIVYADENEDGHSLPYTSNWGRRRIEAAVRLLNWADQLDNADASEREGFFADLGIDDEEHAAILRWKDRKIPCKVLQERPADPQSLTAIENVQRKQVSKSYLAGLTANRYQAYLDRGFSPAAALANTSIALGRTKAQIKRDLKLDEAPAELKSAVDEGDVGLLAAVKAVKTGKVQELLESVEAGETPPTARPKNLKKAVRKSAQEGLEKDKDNDPRLWGALEILKKWNDPAHEIDPYLAKYFVEVENEGNAS